MKVVAPSFDQARRLLAAEWKRARDSRMIAARTVTSVIARSALVRVAREANHRMLRCSYLGSHLEGGA